MYASIVFPEKLKPDELDRFLANGWYRMGQSIFTTHFLCFNNRFYSALWLRVGLTDAIVDTTYKRLQKQNKSFTTTFKKAEITPQHESLYASYQKSIAFEPSETLQSLLYGYAVTNRFHSYEINVHDGLTLIAAGYFDLGKKSAAGIVSFYHPDYKKYSLGKYLIYAKMIFCRERNLDYFYPGYVVPGYPPFDYKATIGRATLEYFSVTAQQWVAYTTLTTDNEPLQLMHKKLSLLQNILSAKNISSSLLYYRFFDARLDPYYADDTLFDFPVFLLCEQVNKSNTFNFIVYDAIHATYALVECSSVIQTNWYVQSESVFSNHLLRLQRVKISAPDAETFIAALIK